MVFVDVGGDVLAHGDEPGLASPLCDAVMLAAAVRMAEQAAPGVLGAVFGIGCDGELTPDEVLARLDEVDRDGGLLGRLPIEEPVARRLDEAVAAVPTEASALALRAFRGESGRVEIRRGRRSVDLRPLAAATAFFDPVVAGTDGRPAGRRRARRAGPRGGQRDPPPARRQDRARLRARGRARPCDQMHTSAAGCARNPG